MDWAGCIVTMISLRYYPGVCPNKLWKTIYKLPSSCTTKIKGRYSTT